MKTSELTGALLDYWVAQATKSWTWAHELFPAMTLDPTFSIATYDPTWRNGYGEIVGACILEPHNAFRQGRQWFRPSTDWAHGGPLIERNNIGIERTDYGKCWGAWWPACAQDGEEPNVKGPTPLIAAMRALVANEFGDEVPDEVPR